jgi:hypothetical protein
VMTFPESWEICSCPSLARNQMKGLCSHSQHVGMYVRVYSVQGTDHSHASLLHEAARNSGTKPALTDRTRAMQRHEPCDAAVLVIRKPFKPLVRPHVRPLQSGFWSRARAVTREHGNMGLQG